MSTSYSQGTAIIAYVLQKRTGIKNKKNLLQKIKGQEKVYQGLTNIIRPQNILNLNKYTQKSVTYITTLHQVRFFPERCFSLSLHIII